jgi:hypothetical protein
MIMRKEKYYKTNKDDYLISTDPFLLDVDVIYNYL